MYNTCCRRLGSVHQMSQQLNITNYPLNDICITLSACSKPSNAGYSPFPVCCLPLLLFLTIYYFIYLLFIIIYYFSLWVSERDVKIIVISALPPWLIDGTITLSAYGLFAKIFCFVFKYIWEISHNTQKYRRLRRLMRNILLLKALHALHTNWIVNTWWENIDEDAIMKFWGVSIGSLVTLATTSIQYSTRLHFHSIRYMGLLPHGCCRTPNLLW